MTKKRVLGKGLSALLESANTDITTKNSVEGTQTVGSISSILISQIEANPFNPRTNFEKDALNELCESIKEHGIIQPLTVRKLGRDKYQLISGERRFRASQLADLTEVPCYIRIANDSAMLEMALVENIQREDLNAIEVALSYQRLIDELSFTQENLGKKLGKSRSNITNYLRLLKLPVKIQVAVREGLISMGHARALVGVNDEELLDIVFTKIISDNLSVRDVEELIKTGVRTGDSKNNKIKNITNSTKTDNETKNVFSSKLKTDIQIKYNNKNKGKIVINFKSEEELKEMIKFLE